MTGKELLLRTLRHERTESVPWVPFAGVHAGKLKGYSAREVLSDGDKLFQSLMEANRQYQPDGQPVMFDLQVEAEILGCKLVWADKAPPSVATHPLASSTEIPERLPEKTDGRLPMVLDVMGRMKRAVGETTALYGLLCGPFTLASHLRGTDIFLDMYDDPEYVDRLMAYAVRVNRRVAEFYIEAGMDVVAIVDPVVSQVSPVHFRQQISGPCRELFSFLREAGVLSSFFVCGDATKNLEEMCLTGPDSISIDENIDMVAAKQITDRYHIAIGGNIPLSSTMLLGTQQDNMQYVLGLLDSLDHQNLIVSPGCDMPYDVPPANVVGVLQAVREPESARHLLSHYVSAAFDADVEMPDYAHLAKPLVEVFTIDSATCPACGYMYGAARAAADHFGDRIEVVERKTTVRENIGRVKRLGIKNLPCLLINGELKFSSIIPSRKVLFGEVEASLKK
jgi:uroporphyrinogen decarboxylase